MGSATAMQKRRAAIRGLLQSDLRALSYMGHAVLRHGRRTGKQGKGGYRREWHYIDEEHGPTPTPLYDGLLIAVEHGADVTLTLKLLQQLRTELRP